MENSIKPCYRCRNFNRYYTRGIKKFNSTKFGWCIKNQEIVSVHDSCNGFIYYSGKKSLGPVKKRLSEILTELCTIRQLIEEANSDDNEEM